MTGFNKQLINLIGDVFEGQNEVLKRNVVGDIADFVEMQNEHRAFQRKTKFYRYTRIAQLMRTNGWKNEGDRWVRG